MSGGGGDKGRNLKGKHYLAIVDIYIFGYNSEFYVAYKEQYVRLHLQWMLFISLRELWCLTWESLEEIKNVEMGENINLNQEGLI